MAIDVREGTECVKNGHYCNGENTVKLRPDFMHYIEKYDLDVMEVCRKALKRATMFVYSFDNIYLEDVDTIRVDLTYYVDHMMIPDEVKITKG